MPIPRPARPIAMVALSVGVLFAACSADAKDLETPTPTPAPTADPGRSIDFELVCSGENRIHPGNESPTFIIINMSRQSDHEFCDVEMPLEEIDFETQYGVGVVRGWFPSGLYSIDVRDVRVSNEAVTIVVELSDPPEFPPPPAAITGPHQLIAVDRSEVEGRPIWQMVTTDGTVLAMTNWRQEWRR